VHSPPDDETGSATEAKSLDSPDDTQVFADTSERAVVRVGRTVIGRGIYQPGWRWSEHARARAGTQSEAHTGLVITGRLAVQAPDGMVTVVGPGEAFSAPPGHDAWVVGDEPCVALDFAPLASS
jgi:hypothetical protein